ncbi:glycosyltransferase family 4 protein [Ferruginibacter lapsinanis]|uniref:glycosyltransferase family 4 protein n=1 Tax=Ferruginibacter lapsinanis TaxID=563172 RepID=UPI001E52BA98|nr:glycosyltransferase family 4 protein [Ferruginibacter lapsinanis]UEG49451.1 glycosyltransferase family 4 protein [Ferruginibacter lapsinanis]
MKLLTLVYSIGMGGTERAAVNYAIGYKQFGNDSRVLALGSGDERLPELVRNNVDTILMSKEKRSIEEVEKELKIWEPDVIHVHNFSKELIPHIERIKGSHTIVVETNVFSRPNYEKEYAIVNLSMQLSNWGYWKYVKWMRNEKYSPEVATIPYIVHAENFDIKVDRTNSDFRRKNNIPEDAFLVGRVGQPHPSKWSVKLVDVIKNTITDENRIYYVLVGPPKDLLAKINELSDAQKKRVICLDVIHGDHALSDFYNSIDCFAHMANIGESFGYVLAEAMLFSVPIVTLLTPLKDNAQFEMIGHYYGGICVTNKEEFSRAILQLAKDGELHKKLKENLTNWIVDRFSPEVVIPKQLAVYQSILAGQKLKKENHDGLINDQFKLWGGRKFYYQFLLQVIQSPTFKKSISFLKGKLKNIVSKS